jgi:hypothetical protein
MSQRLKITLSDTVMAELRSMAARDGVPVARIAAERIARVEPVNGSADSTALSPTLIGNDDDLPADKHAPWIEPVMGDVEWRRRTWGSIVALHGRYPRRLAHLKEGWWKDSSHVKTLAALVVWAIGSTRPWTTRVMSLRSKRSSPTTAISSVRKEAASRPLGSQGRHRQSGLCDERPWRVFSGQSVKYQSVEREGA